MDYSCLSDKAQLIYRSVLSDGKACNIRVWLSFNLCPVGLRPTHPRGSPPFPVLRPPFLLPLLLMMFLPLSSGCSVRFVALSYFCLASHLRFLRPFSSSFPLPPILPQTRDIFCERSCFHCSKQSETALPIFLLLSGHCLRIAWTAGLR